MQMGWETGRDGLIGGSMSVGRAISRRKTAWVCMLAAWLGYAGTGTADEAYRLHRAAEQGDVAGIRQMLAEGDDVGSFEGFWLSTPLHLAAAMGHVAAVQLLLERGANIQAQDALGECPLHVAAKNGRREVVDQLIGVGAWLSPRDFSERTPLHLAAGLGETAVGDAVRATCPCELPGQEQHDAAAHGGAQRSFGDGGGAAEARGMGGGARWVPDAIAAALGGDERA